MVEETKKHCIICLSEVPENKAVYLPCLTHVVFHKDCYIEYIKSRKDAECPICRKSIKKLIQETINLMIVNN